MCCSSRLSRTRETGTGRRLASAIVMVFVLVVAVAAASSSVQAQTPSPTPTPTPTPSPIPNPTPTSINSDLSAGAAVTNLGSNFLERLGNQASSGFGRAFRTNPGGGGASEATDAPQFRTWGEAYGISARTSAQGNFVGDQRQTWGASRGSARASGPVSMSACPSTKAAPRSTFRWRCSRRRSTSPNSASTPRSTRGRGPGP